jgi:hypothetical protein
VKLARLRRTKIACSPSFADFRSKTNGVILLDMGHTHMENMHGRNRERKRDLKLECG